MSGRPNHLVAGIGFVVACIVVACVLYAGIVGGRSAVGNAAGEPTIDNTMVTDMNSTEGMDEFTDPVAPPPPSQGSATNGDGDQRPVLNSCVAGECNWSKTLSVSPVRSEGAARLIELQLLGGSSTYGDEETPIRWNASPHRVWVFCSTTLPATIIRIDSDWQVDVLDLVDGVPNILTSSAAIYMRTCHPGDDRVENDASLLGYRGFDGSEPEVTISNPADMFDRARALSASAPERTPS